MSRPYHHGSLRPELLKAALRVVEHDGAEQLSLRELAREIGVSATASYRHFSGRGALLTAVAALGYAELVAALEESAASDESETHGLLGMARAYISFALDRPNLYRLMFNYPLDGEDEEEKERMKYADRAGEILDEAIAWHLDKLGRSAESKSAAAITGWSGVHGLSLLLMDKRINFENAGLNRDELVERVVQIIVAGLIAPPD